MHNISEFSIALFVVSLSDLGSDLCFAKQAFTVPFHVEDEPGVWNLRSIPHNKADNCINH